MRMARGSLKPRRGRLASSMAQRSRHQRELKEAYPQVRHTSIDRGTADRYVLTVPVNGYPAREVTVEVNRLTGLAAVYADGPTDSPHRYDGGRGRQLCAWYPRDPPEQRWVQDDGLVKLLAMVSLHLFREAYWRERGVWLGPEAPHDPGPLPVGRMRLRGRGAGRRTVSLSSTALRENPTEGRAA